MLQYRRIDTQKEQGHKKDHSASSHIQPYVNDTQPSLVKGTLFGFYRRSTFKCNALCIAYRLDQDHEFCGVRGAVSKRSNEECSFFCSGCHTEFLSFGRCIVVVACRRVSPHLSFQFQSPAFVSILAVILFILSLGFFDRYTIQVSGNEQTL